MEGLRRHERRDQSVDEMAFVLHSEGPIGRNYTTQVSRLRIASFSTRDADGL